MIEEDPAAISPASDNVEEENDGDGSDRETGHVRGGVVMSLARPMTRRRTPASAQTSIGTLQSHAHLADVIGAGETEIQPTAPKTATSEDESSQPSPSTNVIVEGPALQTNRQSDTVLEHSFSPRQDTDAEVSLDGGAAGVSWLFGGGNFNSSPKALPTLEYASDERLVTVQSQDPISRGAELLTTEPVYAVLNTDLLKSHCSGCLISVRATAEKMDVTVKIARETFETCPTCKQCIFCDYVSHHTCRSEEVLCAG